MYKNTLTSYFIQNSLTENKTEYKSINLKCKLLQRNIRDVIFNLYSIIL